MKIPKSLEGRKFVDIIPNGSFWKDDGRGWYNETIFKIANRKASYEIRMCDIDLHSYGIEWGGIDNLGKFLFQMKKVMKADMSNPIIFDADTGRLIDGRHRLLKAAYLDNRIIKAVDIKLPTPDFNFNPKIINK